MSAGVSSGGGGRGNESQDFELNLASIIDCFTVLIAFMLASASFLSIGILDAGIAAAGDSAKDAQGPPPVQVSVEIKKNLEIAVQITGSTVKAENHIISELKSAPSPSGTIFPAAVDYDKLTAELQQIKSRWPTVQGMILTAENDVEYRDVVKTMEVSRKVLPAILLGGF